MTTNSTHAQNILISSTSMFEITFPPTISKSPMFPQKTTALTSSQKGFHTHPTPISFPSWACLLVEGECCYSDFSVTQVSLFRPSLSLFVLSISRLFISYSRLFYSTYIRPYILLVCHNPLLIPLAPIPSPTPFCSESYFYLLMFYFQSVSFARK